MLIITLRHRRGSLTWNMLGLAVYYLLAATLLTDAFKLDFERNDRNPYKSNSHQSRSPQEEPPHNTLYFKDHTPSGVIRVNEGETFTFDCRASGSRPTIHFLLNGQRVLQGASHDVLDDEPSYEDLAGNLHGKTMRLSNTKARLVLDCVSARHSGEYTCVAETPFQRITTTTHLEIVPRTVSRKQTQRLMRRLLRNHQRNNGIVPSPGSSEETCLMKRSPAGVPGRVYMWTDLRVQFEGNSVQLYCRAGGNPAPTITWYDSRGDPISSSEDSQYTLLKNGDLLIQNIAFYKNMGGYQCVAENSLGRDVVETFLYPLGPEER